MKKNWNKNIKDIEVKEVNTPIEVKKTSLNVYLKNEGSLKAITFKMIIEIFLREFHLNTPLASVKSKDKRHFCFILGV